METADPANIPKANRIPPLNILPLPMKPSYSQHLRKKRESNQLATIRSVKAAVTLRHLSQTEMMQTRFGNTLSIAQIMPFYKLVLNLTP
jgi:hypothetical protein